MKTPAAYRGTWINIGHVLIFTEDGRFCEVTMPTPAGEIKLRQFTANYESLGIVIDFLVERPPFDQFPTGKLVPAVKHQIAMRHHVCAFHGETLVGYSGWLATTVDSGRLWLEGKGELDQVSGERYGAAALTVVCADEAAIMRRLIRAMRDHLPGVRVFFRREYALGGQPPRARTVLNMTGHVGRTGL